MKMDNNAHFFFYTSLPHFLSHCSLAESLDHIDEASYMKGPMTYWISVYSAEYQIAKLSFPLLRIYLSDNRIQFLMQIICLIIILCFLQGNQLLHLIVNSFQYFLVRLPIWQLLDIISRIVSRRIDSMNQTIYNIRIYKCQQIIKLSGIFDE